MTEFDARTEAIIERLVEGYLRYIDEGVKDAEHESRRDWSTSEERRVALDRVGVECDFTATRARFDQDDADLAARRARLGLADDDEPFDEQAWRDQNGIGS